MATPVYGKQYIRFAETCFVPCDDAIPQFTLVTVDETGGGAGAPTDPPTAALMAAAGEAWGVLQQEFNTGEPCNFATDRLRLGTVATSGLLLIAADAGNLQVQNDALLVDAVGRSATGGGAVTVNDTTPIVRQQVVLGGVAMVLVSFN